MLLARNCVVWRAALGFGVVVLIYSAIQRLMPEIKQQTNKQTTTTTTTKAFLVLHGTQHAVAVTSQDPEF